MIEWLSSWLREIILVVLFAVITDMLLPNNTMQRYIKVVVSLFILLTILSPILTLIRSDFHYREVEAQLDLWSSPSLDAAVMASQSEISHNAEKLRQLNEQQTVEWVEQRLSDMVKQNLLEQGFAMVNGVRATVDMNASGQADIMKIEVDLHAAQEVHGESTSVAASDSTTTSDDHGEDTLVDPIRPVEPVEPIRVELDWNVRTESHAEQDQRAMQEADLSLRRSIREHIAAEWGVAPEQIVIQEATR